MLVGPTKICAGEHVELEFLCARVPSHFGPVRACSVSLWTRYPLPKNPKNWPAEEEFSSSVLLNQGIDCVSKAAAMEYRVRNPLEHVEVAPPRLFLGVLHVFGSKVSADSHN
jgi:hypothetical protein